ncbi:hypothetical protein ACGRHY_02495 [Streptomyces sp. HK10]
MPGMRRQTVNRVIKDFERRGLPRMGHGRLEPLVVDRLRHRARDRA